MWRQTVCALIAVPFLAGSLVAEEAGDPEKGKKVYRKCKACHFIDKPKKKLGPTLMGVFGRDVASVKGYKYSKLLVKKGKEVGKWDEKSLDAYLTDPKAFIGGRSKMILKLKKQQERRDIIAYLKQQTEAMMPKGEEGEKKQDDKAEKAEDKKE